MISLHRQLIVSSFLVGAPPLAIVAVVSFLVASRQIEAGLQERLLAGVRGAEIAVGMALDRTEARAAAVARDPQLVRAVLEHRHGSVLGLAEQALDIMDVERVTIVDASGRVLARGHAPAEDGDVWGESELRLSEHSWSAVGSGSAGVGAQVTAPIYDAHQRAVAWLIVQKALDHATLAGLRGQFGLEFSAWDGDRLQATTLASVADLAEAERAHQAISEQAPVYLGSIYHFARASFRNEGKGALLVGVDARAAATLETHLSLLYLAVALGLIGLTVAGAHLSARRVAGPIRRLAKAAEAAAGGKLDTAVPLDGPREVQELAVSFTNMLGKRRDAEEELRNTQAELEQRVVARTEALRQSEEHLRQSRQLEALGRLAGGVAHDFNNVLTVIAGNAELLALDLSSTDAPDEILQEVSEIQQGASHAAEIIRQLMAFSRQQVNEPVVLELGRAILELDRMLRRLCTDDVLLSIDVEPGHHRVRADPTQLGQLLVNLVVNAQDALPEGGHVWVRVRDAREADTRSGVLRMGARAYVCLEVADDGMGMDGETARHIFEPFFTTKAPGKGTGLGLATVHGIVKQCGAHIAVDTQPGRGAIFRILFPAAAAEPSALEPSLEPTPPQGRERILICEDEPNVRELTATFLRSGGYDVLVASSGREALALASDRDSVALLVTDVVMPEMNGVQLSRQLRDRLPELRVLYLSGYTAAIIDSRTESGARDELLAKPFTRAELLRRVRSSLDGPRNAVDASGALTTRG
jgi:signal transduction histidine kinase/CheY-like chemotaxis protein